MFIRVLLLAAVVLASAGPAMAWNEKGHYVVSRLAWRQLTPEQRATATKLLKAHPHYDEFLSAEKPDGIDVDEWVFWRAAYWPDWIRNHHTEEFSKPTWHYISAGFVPPYSKLDAAKLELPPPNVVTQITEAVDKLRTGNEQEKPIYLCWLLHLVGDIHQPLHNCSLLSETFPEGDKGGNLSQVRIADGKPVQLHKTFDDLLGRTKSPSDIGSAVIEVDQAERDSQEAIDRELKEHTTPAEWSAEGFALAVKYAYLDGDLKPANADAKLSDADIPQVAELYAQNAGKMARVQVAKAGKRLAVSIAEGLGGKD
jgi:S1/P1 Nuclease